MASSINASTAGAGGVITTADNSGVLNIQTAGTTALTISAAQAATFASTVAVASTIGVGGATPATSGAGITFPATQSASADANTLDDYEEGTWTPTATSQTGSITAYASSGTYTKIGRTVFVNGTISLTTVGTAGGTLSAGGLPFVTTSFANGRPAIFLVRENAATGVMYGGWADGGNSVFSIATLTFGAIVWTNNYAYTFSFTYQV